MANQWFKFYGAEYLSDPKIENLTGNERSCWLTLLCMASSGSDNGVVEFLTTEILLKKSGIEFNPYDTDEWDRCLGVLKKFERMKMIKMKDDGSIEVVNWGKRQEKTAQTPYERVKKYRENKAKMQNDNENDNGDNENDNDRIEENRIEENRIDKNKDTTKTKTKKKGTSPFGKKFSVEGSEIIKAFESFNPACKRYYSNTTQRQACDDLIDIHTLERVLEVIKVLPKSNNQKYLPKITTPLQLLEKWSSLESGLQSFKNDQINKKVKVI